MSRSQELGSPGGLPSIVPSQKEEGANTSIRLIADQMKKKKKELQDEIKRRTGR
jgi:hypothetical protein